MRGCYRTRTIVGNKAEIWGVEYPVLCAVTLDIETQWFFSTLDEHRFAYQQQFADADRAGTGLRVFYTFGYAGNGNWVGIGIQEKPTVVIKDRQSIADDRSSIASAHGVQPWDAAWLQAAYGYAMYPLPEKWQTYTDQTESDAIQASKDAYAKSQGGGP